MAATARALSSIQGATAAWPCPALTTNFLWMKGAAVAHRRNFLPSLLRLHPLGPLQGPAPWYR